jgi:hypothetical protein
VFVIFKSLRKDFLSFFVLWKFVAASWIERAEKDTALSKIDTGHLNREHEISNDVIAFSAHRKQIQGLRQRSADGERIKLDQ